MKNLKPRHWQVVGIMGMIALHSSSIPVLLRVLVGNVDGLPPLDMIFLIWLGLVLMTIRYAFFIRDPVAVFSNAFGVFANTLIMGCIIYYV